MSEVVRPTLSLPNAIYEVRSNGGLIHDLPPDATQELAAEHGLYTTTEQRDPGSFKEFLDTWRREQALATIATRVGTILGRTQQYHDAVRDGVLGEHLVGAFSGITQVECDDVHLAHPDEVSEEQKGIATATETRLFVPNAAHADKVSVAIQALLSTGSLEVFYPVSVDTERYDFHAVVTVGNLDEHAARSLSRSVEAVVAQEDLKQGVTLPPDKRTYADWRDRGETFPPYVDQRLRSAELDYAYLQIDGTYRERPSLAPRPKPRIIGTDAAAFFEGVRDIFNGLIHDVRGGSHLNLEQHPNKAARPLVEMGIDLRRDKATLKDVELGPLSSRPARLTELGLDEGRELIEEARKDRYRALARGVSGAIAVPASILDVTSTAVKYLPHGSAAARQLATARKEWRRRQQAAADGGLRLEKLAGQLRRRQYNLSDWE